ncbi:MBL fold metallo-hydrolase [Laspinema olomoucense]|uniref:MBL fold metallo-hydrolase n=1 Tax=Laspinema olomoucense D3b TaxID=2953688 RepID=A0ABT2NEG0_9CYAN|nr:MULTISPECIES: MBL fold metallo-hydrolase [unclassified Laspinema]MCT7974314.1 MBL fold metallo-hydrolase [Laspinema sp. D3d]MCT7981063.1 MBL fold metallo-hydrolase [Laspinema sp. D3b]MCT7991633.1 MBL fold metallo-hydrolase [Laspinema sp. D3a]
MANQQLRRPENVSGDFYVDTTCIDCDTCRWMAPDIFHRDNEQSAVYQQPQTEAERLEALQALLACPTASIGTVDKPKDIKKAQESFPLLIENNIYHCGYHAESSFGAASYLIQRPEGNILVDSPRFSPPLVQQLESRGGIRYLYLTHQDDVADHQKFAEYFRCDRILHQDEINPRTREVEIQLTGYEPIELESDMVIIPLPGHTKGHTVLLYQNKFLFTGDCLAWSHRLNQLIAFRDACWYSWPELIKSLHKLKDYSFEWILPGHGRRYHAENAQQMQQELQRCLAWMETQ